MKDKTKVKAKNVWKVAKILVANPNATQRDIAKITKMSRNTVIKAKAELSQKWTKDDTIAYIVSSAKSRIKRVSLLFDRYVEQIETKDELDNRDVALAKDIVKDDMARVTVLWWDVTDNNGWLKDMSNLKDMTLDQLDELWIKLKK